MNTLDSRGPVVRACGTLLILLAAASAPAQNLDLVVNGEALVRLVETVSIDEFNARYGTTTLDAIPSRHTYRIQIPAGADPDQFKETIDADPDTVWAELNYFGQAPEARGRCFYYAPTNDAMQYVDQPAWLQIGLPAAAELSTGLGITAAIVDSGIDATHISLANAVSPNGWNFVDQNANTADLGNGVDDDGDGEIDEMTGHGTHVAGIVRRIAPDALLLPIRVLDSDGNSTNFLVAAGIYYAIDQNVDVINVSIGSTYNSQAVLDAVNEATAGGIPVVAAAGNVNVYTPVEYPALHAGVIGVASVDPNDVKTSFSNYHENLTVSAPGEAIFSTLPGDLYAAWNGTSMSTPMATGASALLLARHPQWPRTSLRVAYVRTALLQSAVNIDALNPPYAGLLGAGRLDAAGAVAATEAFAAAVDYGVDIGPETVVMAELTGDGLLDLAVSSAGASSVSVLLNLGAGVFGVTNSYVLPGAPVAVAAGDFDGDGDVDLAGASSNGRVSILLNQGNGTFVPGGSYPLAANTRSLVSGDLDADGDVDLAIPDEGANTVIVLRNNGDGSFGNASSFAVGARPYDLALADADHDDDLDLVTVNRDSSDISVLRNDGTGSFAPAENYTVGAGAGPRTLALGDFNGDGYTDVATANHDTGTISILVNDGSGGFAAPLTAALDEQRQPVRLAAADLDCDGHVDLAITNVAAGGSVVSLLLGRGDGTFLTEVNYAVASDPRGVVAGDLDADTDSDLVIVGAVANAVSVLINHGCGPFVRGDLDCDGSVGFGDINPFVLALMDPAGYEAAFPTCSILHADCNANGLVEFGDINPFIAILTGP